MRRTDDQIYEDDQKSRTSKRYKSKQDGTGEGVTKVKISPLEK